MKQRFLWLALGVFATGCLMGVPVWADHHEAAEPMPEAAEETMPEVAGPIDVNMADAAALQTLPGIGETKAAAIMIFLLLVSKGLFPVTALGLVLPELLLAWVSRITLFKPWVVGTVMHTSSTLGLLPSLLHK